MKMKMAILSLCGIMVLGACGNQEDAKVSENSSTTTQTETTDGVVEKPETTEEVKERIDNMNAMSTDLIPLKLGKRIKERKRIFALLL